MDAQDDPQVDNEVCITSTFPISKDVQHCISSAADSVGLKNIPNYHVERQDHTDWIKATQDSFYPVEVKEGLWIVPQWKTSPDPQAINIVLNPGLAFGTGEHPTTKLCLLLLHNLIKGGEYFLDYGTGSGILAIAALKFGAVVSVGFDIDPQAITSARYNAALNDIGPENLLLRLVPNKNDIDMLGGFPGEAPGLKDLNDQQVSTEMEKYDIVIANILLNPLVDLADKIVSYAKPGAVVGLSGIILEQIPSIVERYSPLLDGIVVSKMDDWACISGYKRKI
ncbi:hypothetical protein Leryth_010071 [Lithospermum erythrorhizon]|nr:hypothetical protein Leryth_010071 [Lithospermum erythrorhizon]